jgi:hypothetical protein
VMPSFWWKLLTTVIISGFYLSIIENLLMIMSGVVTFLFSLAPSFHILVIVINQSSVLQINGNGVKIFHMYSKKEYRQQQVGKSRQET